MKKKKKKKLKMKEKLHENRAAQKKIQMNFLHCKPCSNLDELGHYDFLNFECKSSNIIYDFLNFE